MKYSQPKNTSKSIVHKFSSEWHHVTGGEKWDNVDMLFREIKTNSPRRSFEFTIRYGNPENNEYKVNQFNMNEDEIKKFLDIVYDTVYNPPKFKEDYAVGDKFIIPYIEILNNSNNYSKEIKYTNVEAKIKNTYTLDNDTFYIICFENNYMYVKKDYIDKLERI